MFTVVNWRVYLLAHCLGLSKLITDTILQSLSNLTAGNNSTLAIEGRGSGNERENRLYELICSGITTSFRNGIIRPKSCDVPRSIL